MYFNFLLFNFTLGLGFLPIFKRSLNKNSIRDNIDLIYYHNNYIPLNENNENIKFKNNSYDFNISCINIKKYIINIDNIKDISACQDTFMYLCALESNKKIIKNKMNLIYYMAHESASNTIRDNMHEFNDEQLKFINIVLYNLDLFNNLFKSKKSVIYINSEITNWGIAKLLFCQYKIPGKLSNFILFSKTGIKNIYIKILIYFTIRISPNYFRRYIQNKRFINSKKIF